MWSVFRASGVRTSHWIATHVSSMLGFARRATSDIPMPPPPARTPAELLGLMPFSEALGVALENAERDAVSGSLAWTAERCTAGGVLHGGALMGLADTLGGVCAFLNLPEGATTSTIESKTNFFRGVSSGVVRGSARPVHIGRSTIVVQTELRDSADRLVALVIQTQAVLQAGGS